MEDTASTRRYPGRSIRTTLRSEVAISRLFVLVAAALFSTGGAAIKVTALSSWQVASIRSGIAALTLFILLPAARRRWSYQTLLVGLAYAGALIFYVLANKLTTAANTIFLQSTAPLYILFLGPWLLKEKLRRRDLLFMAALAAGLSFFFVSTEAPAATAPNPLAGNLLAAAGGVCWAFTVVGLRWMGRRTEEGSGLAGAVVAGNLIACLVCLPMALPIESAGAVDWSVLVYLGVVQIGVAYVFLTRALRDLEALEVSLLLLLEPVLNPVWAWLTLDERPGAWAILGGVVILGATAVKTVAETRLARPGRVIREGGYTQ